MALNLTGLTAYVEERKLPLIGEAVLKSKTTSMVNVQTGVKYKAAINTVLVDPTLQDGSVCGFTDGGTTTLTQRVITAPAIKVNMSFCHKDFLKYWTNYETRIAATEEKMPFEEFFINKVIENVKAKNETRIWQDESNGVIAALADGAVTVDSNASAFTAIKNVYMEIPEKVLDKAVIFVGADTYRKFIQEMVEKNLYHYSADGVDQEIYFPGTNNKVVAVNGLNGTKKIVGADPENIFVGVDMVDDAEKFDFWYSKDNDEFRLNIQYNLGAQIAFPNEVAVGGLA